MNDLKNANSQKGILCIEDDRDTCELLSLLFPDYKIAFAYTIADALKFFEVQRFDLILMDNWLPDGSGIELCQKIRAADPDVPIVFTSGVGQKSEIQKAMDAGAQTYLVKPYEPIKLQQIVKELLEK